MWRRHGSNFSKDSEAFDIARGLYDSKGKDNKLESVIHCTVLANIAARLNSKKSQDDAYQVIPVKR